jgi:TIR domain
MEAESNETDKSVKAKTCFVILTFNKRGDYFFDKFVIAACQKAGFTPDRADHQLTRDIADGIVTSLKVSPVVIAYLGSAPWNPNVILELGYRLATRLPLVIVCDEARPGEKLDLPFHLSMTRVVTIPQDEKIEDSQHEKIVDDIVGLMQQTMNECVPFDSNQAVAMIHAPRGPVNGEQAVYVAATRRATDLFGVDGQLVGRTLTQFVADRERDMPYYQYRAFMWEQARLAVVVAPNAPTVIATTPIVFSKGKHKARAYLPIIVNYIEVGMIQEFTVLYLDVTSNVEYIPHFHIKPKISYYTCRLDPEAPAIENFVEPAPVAPQLADGVFLAHNKKDKDRVRRIYDLLKKHGGRPWFDEECIRDGSNWLEEIDKGIGRCRAAFVFVGANGYGDFQDKVEAKHLFINMLERGIPLVPILMDALEKPPGLLKAYQAVNYDVANTDTWIRKFITEQLDGKLEMADHVAA